MHFPPLNIPLEYFYLVLVICLVIITFFIILLVLTIVKTLKNLNKTIKLTNEKIHKLDPVIEGINKLENKADETLTLLDFQLEKIQIDVSRLVNEIIETLDHYKTLEKSLEKKINYQVPPILDGTKELITEVNEMARDIESKIKATDNLFKTIGEAGQTVKMVNGIVKGGLTGLAIQIASMAVGVKKSLEYVSENIHTNKGGEKNG